jgi:hypothetical protein
MVTRLAINVDKIESIEGELDDPATIWCTASESAYKVKQTVKEVWNLMLKFDGIEVASVPD